MECHTASASLSFSLTKYTIQFSNSFILFSITVFNWLTDLIGAHSDITLFLLCDGVQGANKM